MSPLVVEHIVGRGCRRSVVLLLALSTWVGWVVVANGIADNTEDLERWGFFRGGRLASGPFRGDPRCQQVIMAR